MKKNIFALLLIMTLFCSCTQTSVKTQYLYDMINAHGKKYKKKGVMHLKGTGGSIPDQINYFTLCYQCKKELEIDEARVLIVNAVEDFIEMVNSCEGIQPHLRDYPITFENADISISFGDAYGRALPPYVTYVYIARKLIHYKTWDVEKDYFAEDSYKEPYEEALRIVKERGQLNKQMHLLK